MTKADKDTRMVALNRLAVAVQYRLPEQPEDRRDFYRVFIGDLENFSTETYVRACRWLEDRLTFFPKKQELIEACQMVVKRKQDANRPALALPPGDTPITEEHAKNLRQLVQQRIGKAAMR